MRYFLQLSYKGTNYHGWQIQPNARSVQEETEKALRTILREEISLTGAGRTDAGVHARTMYAHFDTTKVIEDKKRFLLSMNRLVGNDINLEGLKEVASDAHARFDATLRKYKYFVSFSKNSFFKDYFWQSPSALNVSLMNEAAERLKEIKDFTSFAKLHSDSKTNICLVKEAFWQPISSDNEAMEFLGEIGNGIVFTISADRFLRNMVRAIVGTLIDVGRGKLSPDEFVEIIYKKDRCEAGVSMPAGGLFLWDIKYPY